MKTIFLKIEIWKIIIIDILMYVDFFGDTHIYLSLLIYFSRKCNFSE